MLPDIHAVVILMTVVVPLILIGLRPAWRPRSCKRLAIPVLALGTLGLVCSCFLTTLGTPRAEWFFPMIGVCLAGLFMRSDRVYRVTSWSLVAAAVALSYNSLMLRDHGYTSAPETSMSAFRGFEQGTLALLGKDLRTIVPPDRELPAGPLKDIVPRFAGWTDIKRCNIRATWHTLFTGLYKIEAVPGQVWYPGGPVAKGSQQLEWRPK